MLTLNGIDGKVFHLPYHGEYPVWKFLAEIVAPAANFRLCRGTMWENVICKGVLLGYHNKHLLLKDFIEDGSILFYTLPLGRNNERKYKNACEEDDEEDDDDCGGKRQRTMRTTTTSSVFPQHTMEFCAMDL